RKRQLRRMSVPLVMAATAAGMGAPAYAAGKEHQASAKAGARRVHPRILRIGDRGPDVLLLQRDLGIPADGIFGPQTLHAVKRFQATHGLLVDGQVGPYTRAALHIAASRDFHYVAPAAHSGGGRTTTHRHHRHQRPSHASTLGERAVALARAELGVPYVWGGES